MTFRCWPRQARHSLHKSPSGSTAPPCAGKRLTKTSRYEASSPVTEKEHDAEKEFKICLNAPAFLGDADQKGVWRTPPIKAMLREWWRVAAAPEQGYRHEQLRQNEGKLFGNAWLDDDFSKSLVRLALEHWHAGKMTALDNDPKVTHPEVKFPVGSQLYLGYGPLIFQQGVKLKTAQPCKPMKPTPSALPIRTTPHRK